MSAKKSMVYTVDEIPKVAQILLEFINQYRVITFTGPLGAGKTTLIRELSTQLGVQPHEITSPTFTYVNIYRLPDKKRLYHFDLYRIGSLEQFQEMGFDEYLFDPESLVFIEWPEVIQPLLKKHCAVSLDYHEDPNKRIMHVECIQK